MLIILLGAPGCGKTSVGEYLANEMGYTWVDVDDHILEPAWKCSVSEKLQALGPQLFLKEEGQILQNSVSMFQPNTVLSLTGSNPLDDKVMLSLKVTSISWQLIL